VKCIDKTSLAPEDEDALRLEVKVLEMADHPNIVKLKEVFDCPKTFYMVMEEMSGGELFDRIVDKEKYSEREASNVVKRLAGALLYCHNLGIVHRDLKVPMTSISLHSLKMYICHSFSPKTCSMPRRTITLKSK
jgi:calcium/calmodulin-dependent protein kinase I